MKTDYIKQIKDIAIQAEPILAKNKKHKEIEIVHQHLKIIENTEISILICGEFKRGKSSFINAFLEQELCPVDVDIATASVSVIKYGETNRVIRQFGDIHDLQSETYDSLEAVNNYAAGCNIDNTVLLTIETPNPKLKEGLVLIDTPGVGGLDPRHAFLTNYILPNANIVFFVTDKDQPITGAEISFFEEKIIPFAQEKALIINKADLMKDSEESDKWIEDAQRKCAAKGELTVVPVSARLKQRYLVKGKEKDYQESNFAAVERLVENLTNSYKKNQLLELRDFIVSIFEELVSPIHMQISQIIETNPELVSKLEDEIREYQLHKANLNDATSEYRMQISKIIKNAKSKVDNKLNTESVRLQSEVLDSLLANEEIRKNIPLLKTQLRNYISQIASELDMLIDPTFPQIISLLGCKSNKYATKEDEFTSNIDFVEIKKPLTDHAANLAKSALPGFGLGMLVAVITGGAAIPVIAGLALAGKQFGDITKGEAIASLKQKIIPELTITISELRSYIQKRYDTLNDTLLMALKDSNDAILENMTAAAADLNALKNDSAELKRKKKILLDTELKPLEQILITAKIFLSNPFDKNN